MIFTVCVRAKTFHSFQLLQCNVSDPQCNSARCDISLQYMSVWMEVNVEWKASTWMISCMFVNPRQDLPVSLALLTGAYSLKSTALSVCTTGLCGFMIVWEYGKTCALPVCQPHIHQGFEVLVLWVSFHIGYSLYSLLMDQTGSSIATGAAATKWP